MSSDRRLVVKDVQLIDPDDDAEAVQRDIVVEGDKVVAVVRPGAERHADDVLDGSGMFVLPPLVNAHDHLYSHELGDPTGRGLAGMRAELDARSPAHTLAVMLRAAWTELSQGVGVIRDLGANHGLNVEIARLFRNGTLPGPDVVAAGRPIVMTGGHVWTFGREADGPWEARKAVREQAKSGAAVIKIMASGGLSHFPQEDFSLAQFTDDELMHIVDESHARGLRACAHAFGRAAVASVVRMGVDSVEHGVDIDDETIAAMVEVGVWYVPTLTNMERVASVEYNRLGGTPERSEILSRGVVDPHRDTFTRAHRAGVRVALGTDSTGNLLDEALRMVELGMSPANVVRAATTAGSELCSGMSNAVRAGADGSFSLYRDDPRRALDLLTSPEVVISRGARFEPDAGSLDETWVANRARGVSTTLSNVFDN